MKNILKISILMLCVCCAKTIKAQEDTTNNKQMSLKVAEIVKMVDLEAGQIIALQVLDSIYKQAMDSAIYKVVDRTKASELIFLAKKHFNTGLMKLLNDKQKAEYTHATAYSEIIDKAEEKVESLRQTEKYSKEELNKFKREIFDYLMKEKIVYATDKYNIKRQKENIAQLKKMEPRSLKEANTLKKAKHQGVTYQGGYKW